MMAATVSTKGALSKYLTARLVKFFHSRLFTSKSHLRYARRDRFFSTEHQLALSRILNTGGFGSEFAQVPYRYPPEVVRRRIICQRIRSRKLKWRMYLKSRPVAGGSRKIAKMRRRIASSSKWSW